MRASQPLLWTAGATRPTRRDCQGRQRGTRWTRL